MKKMVTIVDYGIGNVLSVARAFEHCGAETILTDDNEKIVNADYLVLPGVGAFADGMNELKKRHLVETIHDFVKKERPFLGICLGMQMMMDYSEEFGHHEGLGLIKGAVKRIDPRQESDHVTERYKVPNVGWYEIYPPSGKTWDDSILKDCRVGSSVYLVHSFAAEPIHLENLLAYYNYGNQKVCAAVEAGLIYGCQFHPEKSGGIGLRIISSFLEL